LADSGNGWHLCYRIDMPNDAPSRELLRDVLKGLDQRCSTEAARVDAKVFNASRIWKLYGTTARNGAATPERPHRPGRIGEGEQTPRRAELAGANTSALGPLREGWAPERPAAPPPTQADPSPFSGRAGGAADPVRAYVLAALRSEAAAVAGAAPGSRNNT